MEALFHLFLSTYSKKILEEEVRAIIIRGSLGYFEVLPHHAPLISTLLPGKLVITKSDNQKIIMDITGGVIEVSYNQCSILADGVENIAPYDSHADAVQALK